MVDVLDEGIFDADEQVRWFIMLDLGFSDVEVAWPTGNFFRQVAKDFC